MDFEQSARSKDVQARVRRFIAEHVRPAEEQLLKERQQNHHGGDWHKWKVPPIVDELKARARKESLWNLFLPDPVLGGGLSVLEYAPVAEETGKCLLAPEVFNCSAPDTGNME